ncbi:MAG: branched-chain amino acid ABC transporter permease [Betaproteobacteria bacterium]|nr:branched-chain amino acid ABC transporter permease [Betaproteobacteria bacterium]
MIVQAIVDGIFTGAIVSLGAIGLSLTLQIMRFANFAHAEFMTIGAYLALAAVGLMGPGAPSLGLSFGWQLLVAACLAAALAGVLSWGLDLVVFRPLRRSGAAPLVLVFAAFGAALILRHVLVLIWGHDSYFYTRELQLGVMIVPGVRVLPDQVFILALAIFLVTLLHLYLTHHRTGIAMRAMAESPSLSQVCGIEVDRVMRTTWIISGFMAAMAGVFSGLTPQLHPELGSNILLSIFTAAIFGGVGSLPGAVLGGLLVGIAENLFLLVADPGYKPAMPFLLLLGVLWLRPQGLLGEKAS